MAFVRLMVSGLLESVLGENLACLKPGAQARSIGADDIRNSPVGVRIQVKLICRPDRTPLEKNWRFLLSIEM